MANTEIRKDERRKESESDRSSKQNDYEVIDAQTPDIVQPEKSSSSDNYEEVDSKRG